MKKLIVTFLTALSVGLLGPQATAKDIVTVPICDLEGHCDGHCTIGTKGIRCGRGPG